MPDTTGGCGCDEREATMAANVKTGTFELLPQRMRLQFQNGTVVIGPADGMGIPPGTAALDPSDILKTFCRVFPAACGTKPGKSEPEGCYKIIGPDGTTIRICPPGTDPD